MEMAVKVRTRRKADPDCSTERVGRAWGQHSLRVGARSLVPD